MKAVSIFNAPGKGFLIIRTVIIQCESNAGHRIPVISPELIDQTIIASTFIFTKIIAGCCTARVIQIMGYPKGIIHSVRRLPTQRHSTSCHKLSIFVIKEFSIFTDTDSYLYFFCCSCFSFRLVCSITEKSSTFICKFTFTCVLLFHIQIRIGISILCCLNIIRIFFHKINRIIG